MMDRTTADSTAGTDLTIPEPTNRTDRTTTDSTAGTDWAIPELTNRTDHTTTDSADRTDQGTTEAVEVARQRVRVVYAKDEAIKFLSHHDEFRLWERTLRRAELPLLYKNGFNPQPHIQFASPLGVGITGAREPVDITFSPPLAIEEIAERLSAKLPPGVRLVAIEEVARNAAALQSLLIGADYTILIYAEAGAMAGDELRRRIQAFLGEREIWRERERKGETYTYNLRPLVLELRYEGYDAEAEEHRIFLRVQQRSGATGRPDEVVDAMELDDFARTLRRDRLYLADEPGDVAVFAPYRVITQGEIAGKAGQGRSLQQRRKDEARLALGRGGGRSINERAGDEFA